MSHWSEMNRRSQGISQRREDIIDDPRVDQLKAALTENWKEYANQRIKLYWILDNLKRYEPGWESYDPFKGAVEITDVQMDNIMKSRNYNRIKLFSDEMANSHYHITMEAMKLEYILYNIKNGNQFRIRNGEISV